MNAGAEGEPHSAHFLLRVFLPELLITGRVEQDFFLSSYR